MTDQKVPDGTRECPEGGSVTPAPPEGRNEPQAGAQRLQGEQQPRGPVDWARQQAAEREAQAATDPRQPAYDAVFAYIRELGDYMPPAVAHRNAAIWRGVHAALDAANVPTLQQPAHNAGPSVREAAAQDRAHWTAKYAGEDT